jgi:hypothetical protein
MCICFGLGLLLSGWALAAPDPDAGKGLSAGSLAKIAVFIVIAAVALGGAYYLLRPYLEAPAGKPKVKALRGRAQRPEHKSAAAGKPQAEAPAFPRQSDAAPPRQTPAPKPEPPPPPTVPGLADYSLSAIERDARGAPLEAVVWEKKSKTLFYLKPGDTLPGTDIVVKRIGADELIVLVEGREKALR